jgi:hypothetical protein
MQLHKRCVGVLARGKMCQHWKEVPTKVSRFAVVKARQQTDLLCPRLKSTRYQLDRRLGGPQSQSGRHGEVKNP